MPHLLLAFVLLQLQSLSLGFGAEILEKFNFDYDPYFTCAQVLTDCRVKDAVFLEPVSGPVGVNQLELKPLLCCREQTNCKPCMQIKLHFIVTENLTDTDNQEKFGNGNGGNDDVDDTDDYDYESHGLEESEFSGHYTPEHTAVSMSLCYTVPHLFQLCKKIEFTLPPAVVEEDNMSEVWLSLVVSNNVVFGSEMKVQVSPSLQYSITIPSTLEVCSSTLQRDVDECDVPTLQTVIDGEKSVVTLQLDTEGVTHSFPAMLLMKYGEKVDSSHRWLNRTEKIVLPLASVAPCLCFQVWWVTNVYRVRAESCPFLNQTELMKNVWNNITTSVVPAPMNNGNVALSWTLSTPCRVEADVWPCHMMADGTNRCNEVRGFRQRRPIETQKKGVFHNITAHPHLCVLVKIEGKDSELGPFCPFATPRSHWRLAVPIGLALLFLGVLCCHLMQGALKRWAWKWFKDNDIRGAIKGGQVVLLCPPDPDPALPELVCRLGSSLLALGFTVSLDLWSSAELSALGPVPWLHSRLDCLQRQGGGKVVLLLTGAACKRVEEWSRSRVDMERPIQLTSHCRIPTCTDVFSASLSCILADRLQGRAGKRFVLAQFEALPPPPLEASQSLPELFRGMPLYSLPSQSLAFLTELAGGLGEQSRKRRAGRLRAGSRILTLGLGVPVHLWETVPLKPRNAGSISSPCIRDTEWV